MHDRDRKDHPIYTGLMAYFPKALAAVAGVSMEGARKHGTFNDKGEPTWDRSKSTDDADALARHLLEKGKVDSDGYLHSAKVAWRALAVLEKELDAAEPTNDPWSITKENSAVKAEQMADAHEINKKMSAALGSLYSKTTKQRDDEVAAAKKFADIIAEDMASAFVGYDKAADDGTTYVLVNGRGDLDVSEVEKMFGLAPGSVIDARGLAR